MDERVRRLWAGSEAIEWGRGGLAGVVQATGLSYETVRAGVNEIQAGARKDDRQEKRQQPLRRSGGGRHSLVERHPELLQELEARIDVDRGRTMLLCDGRGGRCRDYFPATPGHFPPRRDLSAN